MENSGTRQQILDASLELFSVQGYEATSISQIADAVGLRKASLYSHFKSKQDILDCLIAETLEGYASHSAFAEAQWNDPEFLSGLSEITPEGAAHKIKEQIRYLVTDPYISRGRKMLVIEQFRNTGMAKLLSKRNYDDVVKYHTELMNYLMDKNIIRRGDPVMLACEYCLPVTAWLNVLDREPERMDEMLDLIERHVIHFFEINGK